MNSPSFFLGDLKENKCWKYILSQSSKFTLCLSVLAPLSFVFQPFHASLCFFFFCLSVFLFPGSVFSAPFCFSSASFCFFSAPPFVSFLPAFPFLPRCPQLFFSFNVLPFFQRPKHFFQPKTIFSCCFSLFYLNKSSFSSNLQ